MRTVIQVIGTAFTCWLCVNGAEQTAIGSTNSLGAQLARQYCQTCHLFPEPSLLDKETWIKGALHRMAPLMGAAKVNLRNRPDGTILEAANVFPPAPIL